MTRRTQSAVALLLAMLGAEATQGQAAYFESFEGGSISSLQSQGWIFRNQSDHPVGAGWSVDGGTSPDGAAHLATGNGAAERRSGAVSAWAVLPPVPGQAAGDMLSFFYETGYITARNDSIELRYSPSGGTSTGQNASDAGDFTTVLWQANGNDAPLFTEVRLNVPGPGRLALCYRMATAENPFNGLLRLDALSIGTPDRGGDVPIPHAGQTVTWTLAGSPYVIDSEVMRIPTDGTVVIEPGVEVQIPSGNVLVIDGAVTAHGTSAAPIVFSSSTNFPPAVEINGTLDVQHAALSGQIRPHRSSTCRFVDCSFSSPGGLYAFESTASGPFAFVELTRCTFDGAPVDLAATAIRMREVAVNGSYVRSHASLNLDNVTVRNSPVEGFIISETVGPLYINNVQSLDSTGAGFNLHGADYFFGPDNTIAGNTHPVALPEGAGFVAGSILPLTGNDHNLILGPAPGDVLPGDATWPDMNMPYLLEAAVVWFGRLDIGPGAEVLLDSDAGLEVRNSNFFRGLPGDPVRFGPATPGGHWFNVVFVDVNSGMEYCQVDGGGVTVAYAPFAHLENSILSRSRTGLGPGAQSDWFIAGTQFLNNELGARTNHHLFGTGGLHLNSATNPNSFVGNVEAIRDISPGSNVHVDARNCWWGDASGPQHPLHPGGTGDPLTSVYPAPYARVGFDPWLTSAPDYSNHPPVVRLATPPFTARPGDRLFLNWEASDDDAIVEQRVLFSAEDHVDYEMTLGVLPPNARSFEWVVPEMGFLFNSPSYVRIVAVDSGGREGWDQAPITIPSGEVAGTLAFAPPPTGPILQGDDIDVCWTLSGGDANTIVGQPFIVYEADEKQRVISGFDGCTFLTKAPIISTDRARVVVPLQGNCCNRVDFFFSDYIEIRPDRRMGDTPPSVTMLTPSTGDSFAGGGVVPITWTAADDEALRSFKIQISTDAGRTWQTIARDLPATATSYDWRLPTSGGVPDARVRVVAVDLRFQNSADGDDRPITITPGTASGCPADMNGDGASDVFDLLAYLDNWFAGNADRTGDGVTDVFDLLSYLDDWFGGC